MGSHEVNIIFPTLQAQLADFAEKFTLTTNDWEVKMDSGLLLRGQIVEPHIVFTCKNEGATVVLSYNGQDWTTEDYWE